MSEQSHNEDRGDVHPTILAHGVSQRSIPFVYAARHLRSRDTQTREDVAEAV